MMHREFWGEPEASLVGARFRVFRDGSLTAWRKLGVSARDHSPITPRSSLPLTLCPIAHHDAP